MKIAVLGFGSLVNNLTSQHYGHTLDVEKHSVTTPIPKNLNIGVNSPFLPAEGLRLPIRLGRLSSSQTENRRITMVLHDGASDEDVYFAVSRKKVLKEAIQNLAKREGLGTFTSAIGYVNLCDGSENSSLSIVAERIRHWAQQKGFEAVIWTDLDSTIEFEAGSTGKEILPLLQQDPILLANTKKYIKDLPNPYNSLQEVILGL